MKNIHSLWLLPVAAIVSSVYAADYLTVEQTQKAIFADAQSFEAHPVKFTSDQQDKIKSLSGLRQRWDTQQIWRAVKNGKTLGWFVVDEVIGKHEFITYGVGVSPDGLVVGVEIMTYRETYGGGVRDAIWRQHLVGKTLADPFKLDEDVPNISGGTLSSRNVIDGVKRVLTIQKVLNLAE